MCDRDWGEREREREREREINREDLEKAHILIGDQASFFKCDHFPTKWQVV